MARDKVIDAADRAIGAITSLARQPMASAHGAICV
jgi:hypothetical protein